MKVRYTLIDNLLSKLYSKHAELRKAPIKIDKLIKRLEIELIQENFDYQLSGAAMIDDGRKIISINKRESPLRKRFTMAHELGHIFLHYDLELNVDIKPISLNRDLSSTTGEDWREVEANYFAASILMPKELIEKYYEELYKECEDEDVILEKLSKKFKVSMQAISIRLSRLGLLSL